MVFTAASIITSVAVVQEGMLYRLHPSGPANDTGQAELGGVGIILTIRIPMAIRLVSDTGAGGRPVHLQVDLRVR